MPVAQKAAIVSPSEDGFSSSRLFHHGLDKSESIVAGRFCRSNRLLSAQDYAKVFSARQQLRAGLFALHYRSGQTGFPRLGLVIPKKQARLAVLRNAIKRQARESFRHRLTQLPALDLVLRLTRPVKLGHSPAKADRRQWREEIDGLLARLTATGKQGAS